MAGLQPTRGPVVRVLEGFDEPPEFGSAPQRIVVEQWFWDHPTMKISHLLKQVRHVHNWQGHETEREVDVWQYEGYTDENQQWTCHHKEVWSWTWIPGRHYRTGQPIQNDLIKCEEHFTVKELGTAWVAGPIKTTTHIYGWAVYDLQADWYTEEQVREFLENDGRRPPNAPGRIIPDSGRRWTKAIHDAAIVKEEDVNQVAIWQLLEIVREDVDEDFLRTIRWRTRVDCLTGLSEFDGPTEESKDISLSLPLPLEAPKLKAEPAGAKGVRLEVRGGGAEFKTVFPVPKTEYLQPESYAIYRKTTSRPARSYDGDRFGLYESAPAEDRVALKLEDTAVKDLAGAPADPLPAQVGYTEPEDATPVDAEFWELVLELDQREEQPDKEPWSAGYDELVEAGASYEYFAVSRLRGDESPESNHEGVSFAAGKDYASRIRVRVSEKPGESLVSPTAMGLEIEVLGPADPLLEELGLEDFGQQAVYEVPAAVVPESAIGSVDVDGGEAAAWPDGVSSAEDLGRAVGLAQFDRDRDGDLLRIQPTVPLLSLRRGQVVTVPQVAWETYGRGLHLTTRLVDAQWLVEGFGFTVQVGDDGRQTVSVDPIEVEEIPR